MGWFRQEESPRPSVITDDTRRARETIEFEIRRRQLHHLCGLELSDIAPFVDEIVKAINSDYLACGRTAGASIEFPEKLQPVAMNSAFQKAFFHMVLQEVHEADRDGLFVGCNGDRFYMNVVFPEITSQSA
jgi:hypothetical protein